MYPRKQYMKEIISKKDNGCIKIITGLRNARLGFRQLEESHIMEHILYNDLIRRGMNVDVGVVEYNAKDSDGKKVLRKMSRK